MNLIYLLPSLKRFCGWPRLIDMASSFKCNNSVAVKWHWRMAVPSILIIQNWIWGERIGFQGDDNDHLPI